MSEPLTVVTLIKLLQEQLEVAPDAIVEIEDNYKFWHLRVVPIRYTPDAEPMVTLRKTTLAYED